MFEACACGSGKAYLACCGRLHNGTPAETAEELMRARYTAYARGNRTYLLKSWASETRPFPLKLDPAQSWTGLTIEKHEVTGPDTALVRFTATYKAGKQKGRMTETSRFRREGAGWVYIDGQVSG